VDGKGSVIEMEGFVAVSQCIDCGVPTDRNGDCVGCGKTITSYRLRHEGKMRLVFCDGAQVAFVADIRCQRCGCVQISDTFESEGTCWKCRVHNTIKPRVMGQWRFYQYQVTLAPCTVPVKNVIKEMSESMAKKVVYRGGLATWVDVEDSPKVGNIEEILDQVWQEASIPIKDTKAHRRMEGVHRHIGFVTCLGCGGRTTRLDKSCRECDTTNDIVIRQNVSGHIVVTNVTHQASGRGTPLIHELKVIKCFWCPDKEISQDLKCPRCGVYFDAVMQELTSVKTVEGRTYQEYNYEVSLCRHQGERPEHAIKLELPTSSTASASDDNKLQQKGSPATTDFPPFPRVETSRGVPAASETSTGTQQSTALVLRTEQSPIVTAETSGKKPLTAHIFGRHLKQPSVRTLNRHSKVQRDAERASQKKRARRLEQQGFSLRKIAVALSDQYGKKFSTTKVKNLLTKD